MEAKISKQIIGKKKKTVLFNEINLKTLITDPMTKMTIISLMNQALLSLKYKKTKKVAKTIDMISQTLI